MNLREQYAESGCTDFHLCYAYVKWEVQAVASIWLITCGNGSPLVRIRQGPLPPKKKKNHLRSTPYNIYNLRRGYKHRVQKRV